MNQQVVNLHKNDPVVLSDIEQDAAEKTTPAATNAESFLSEAENMEIASPSDANSAAAIAKTISQKAKELDSERKAITNPLDESKKRTMALFKVPIDSLNQAVSIIRGKVTKYQLDLEKKAREEQAALDEKARKEREKLEKRAEAAAAKGQTEKAEALTEQAATQVVTHQAVIPKTKGASVSKTWVGEVVDIKALCGAIADGRVPASFVAPVDKAINDYARATKGSIESPGINFYEKSNTSFR